MSNPKAIVSNIIRFEPKLDRTPEELLHAEHGLSVELEYGLRVHLDFADPRSVGFVKILEGLSNLHLPVYLEIDPATSVITRLFIPHLSRATNIHQGDEGELDIELEHSHGRHVLRRDQPNFEEFEKLLRKSVESREPVILTEDDKHNIIDIRILKPGPDIPSPFSPETSLHKNRLSRWLKDLLRRIGCWKWWPWWWFCCLSKTKAQQIFDAMNTTSCEPLAVPPPCIPFLYPDDGCWARAHEMCRLMINMGLSPRKVWIRSQWPNRLHVDTKNNPACFVEWGGM